MSVRRFCSSTFAGIFSRILAFTFLAGLCAQAQTFTVLYDATGGSDISNPASHLVAQGRDGNMYFTSPNGGTFYGTLFKITPAGKTTIYDVDGFPVSGATLGSDGNFYVTDQDEGPGGNCGFSGCGQVLKITSGGTQTVLYNFKGESDGSSPQAAPVEATNGVYYGTTLSDGNSDSSSTAYSITSSGTFTTLHIFASTEGSGIGAELLQASDGNLYGMANSGGANGFGSIFKMTLAGTVTVLHSFDNSDGANPCCGLIEGTDGNLYGATSNGGAYGYGTIFKITLGGTYTDLHDINPANGDGQHPGSTLTQGSDGKLYGVTSTGTDGVNGTLFNMTTSGTFKTLYTFCTDGTCTDGSGPSSPLKQNTNGIFYGSTYDGGDLSCGNSTGCGNVYSLNMGLKAFASLTSTSADEGAKVGILGQGFSKSSAVAFDGVKATAVTLSGSTYLSATVPSGALTGAVTVTTGSTVLTTPQTFKVLPTLKSFSPTSGAVGTVVTLTGTGLQQTTKVTFDSKSASFTVVSDTEVTATVPTGAKTGKIAITTKGGSVTSATNFTVN